MAISLANSMGLQNDVFSDPKFQKNIDASMEKAIAIIDSEGFRKDLNDFLVEHKDSIVRYDEERNCFTVVNKGVDTSEITEHATKAELTAAFIDQFNAVGDVLKNLDKELPNNTELKKAFEENNTNISDFLDIIHSDRFADICNNIPELKGEAINTFKNSLVELSDRADRINAAIAVSNNYAHLDSRNVFRQFQDLKLKIIAKENNLPLNGKYVPSGDIFMSAYRLCNSLTLDNVILSAIEKYIDHLEGIDNVYDLERYYKTGSVDKTENNDIAFSLDNGTVLSANDTIDFTEKKIGNVKMTDLVGVKLGNVDLTDKYGRTNVVTDDRNRIVVDGKVTIAIRDFIPNDKRDGFSSDYLSKMTYTDKEGNSKIRGFDSPVVVGYKIIDVESKKTEIVVKGNHICGETFRTDFYDLKLDADQKYLYSIKDKDDLYKLTGTLADKLEPGRSDVEREYDKIEKRIDNIDSILNDPKSSITSDEKEKLETFKTELENDKAVLSLEKGSTDKERIELADKKAEVCQKDHSETEIESKYKEETAWNKVEAAIEKEEKGEATKDEVNDARKEYIESSELSKNDKDTLVKCFDTEPKETDSRIKDVSFEDKAAVSEIIEKIYGKDIEGSSKDDFESEIFKKAVNNDYEFKSDTIDRNNDRNDTDSSEKRNDTEKTKNYELGTVKIDESTKVVREDNKYYLKSANEKISVSDIGAVTKNRVEVISQKGFNNIVSFKGGNVVNDGKLVVAVKGYIEQPDRLSADFKDKMTHNAKTAGIDRPITLGYAVFDLDSGKTEYRDLRFEHKAGDDIDIDKKTVSFSREQSSFLEYRPEEKVGIKNDDVKELTVIFESKISLSDKDIDDKVETINEKIAELESIKNSDFISADEKAEIEEKISSLGSTIEELKSDNVDFSDKLKIYNEDITATKAETDHKEDILRQNMHDGSHDYVDSRIDYIGSLSLSDDDKQKLYNAVSKDFSSFDQALKDKTFDDPDKIKAAINEMYHQEITYSDPDEFRSDVCKDTYEQVLTDSAEKIEYEKTDDGAKVSFFKDDKEYRTDTIDKSGNIVQRDEYHVRDDRTYFTVTRDSDDKMVEAKNYDSDSKLIGTILYDDNEEIIEKSEYDYRDDGSYIIEYFDKEDNLTKAQTFDGEGNVEKNIIAEYDNDKISVVSTYDKDFRLIEKEYYDDNTAVEKTEIYKYNDDGSVEVESYDKDNNFISADDKPDTADNETADVVETADDTKDIVADSKEDNIRAGIEQAIDRIKDGAIIDNDSKINKNKINAVVTSIERTSETIKDIISSKTEKNVDPGKISGLIIDTILESGVDFDKKPAQISNYLEAVEHGVSDEPLIARNIDKAMDDPAVISDITVGDTDYKTEWLSIEGTEEDKIASLIDVIAEHAIDNDNAAEVSGIIAKINSDTPEINANAFAEAVSSLEESNSDVVNVIKTEFLGMEYDGFNDIEKKVDHTSMVKMEIDYQVSDNDDRIAESCKDDQKAMISEFVDDKTYSTLEFLDNFISGVNSGEASKVVNGSEEVYERSALNDDNFESRFEIMMDRLAEYAQENPDKTEGVADALSRIAKDTGCISKVQVAAEERFSNLGIDPKPINDIFMSRIDDMIDSIYGVTRDEDGNIDKIELDDDKIEKAKADIGEIVHAVIDIMISDNDDDIKETIHDLVDKAAFDDRDNGGPAQESRGDNTGVYLDRLKQVMSAVNNAIDNEDKNAVREELEKFDFELNENDEISDVDRVMEVFYEDGYQDSMVDSDSEFD